MNDGLSKQRAKRAQQQQKTKKTASKAKKKQAFQIPLKTLLSAGLVWLGVVLLISVGEPVTYINLTENQKVPSTVIAEVPFVAPDLERTALEEEKAASNVLPVFGVNENQVSQTCKDLENVFNRWQAAGSLANQTNDVAIKARSELTDLLQTLDIKVEASALLPFVVSNHLTILQSSLIANTEALASHGIYDPKTGIDSPAVQLRSKAGDLEQVSVNQLNQVKAVATKIAATTIGQVGHAPGQTMLEAILTPLLRPNLTYNTEVTEKIRSDVRKDVAQVMMKISPGETLAEAGEIATPQIIAKLLAHKTNLGLQSNPLFKIIGNGSILLAALFIVGGLLLIVNRRALERPNLIILAGILSLIPLASAKALVYLSNFWPFLTSSMMVVLIPIAIAPLLATLLVNSRYALAVGVWTSFVVAVLVEQSFTIFVLGLVVTVIASVSVRDLHKRSNLYRAGIMLGAAKAVFITGAAALTIRALDQFIPQIVAAFLSGIVVALMTILLVPLFEWVFRLTSPIKLLELLDMRHPLIERLMLEAPGTYHHSLMVANISQAAASEIGANDLLVRVVALYHDIGKLIKPEYFIENAAHGKNPHDDLTPSMSTLLIIAHVKEGITLAKNYNLPEPILNGIQTHHGTQIVSYFYHRAKEMAEDDSDIQVSRDDFRYPGPLPESPEMGILMLADSIEAASRTLDNPTNSNIGALVNQIVDDKLEEGQLDKSDLTFAQLCVLKKSFIYTLTSMMHHRVAYPKDENRDTQSTDNGTSKRDQTVTISPMAHAKDPRT